MSVHPRACGRCSSSCDKQRWDDCKHTAFLEQDPSLLVNSPVTAACAGAVRCGRVGRESARVGDFSCGCSSGVVTHSWVSHTSFGAHQPLGLEALHNWAERLPLRPRGCHVLAVSFFQLWPVWGEVAAFSTHFLVQVRSCRCLCAQAVSCGSEGPLWSMGRPHA